MADYAHAYTDEQIKDLERQIHAVYAEASRDMQAKLDEFNAKFEVKDRAHRADVESGKWTQEQYDNWRRGQIFQSQQWEAKRDDLVNTMHNTNVVAAQMINGRAPDVFGVNASYMNYSLEYAAGVNFGFGIYDASTVARLIRDNPQMLPEWKIDEKKDYIWNEKKVNNAVTQGIIQGESLSQISRRISHDLVMQNEDLSRTFAQTAMTGAQNAGRQESLEHATSMGIEVYKQWMATLDSHTRSSHADVDGESVPVNSKFSNGLQYPAEAGGPPAEVYNCRCTMVGDLKKYPEKFKRYNNEKGKPIQYMSYRDWEKAKNYGKAGYKASVDAKEAEYAKYGGKETYSILGKYKDVDDLINNATKEELEYVSALDTGKVKEFYESKQPELTPYEKAQAELEKAEAKIHELGADKTFSDIWYGQTVTYADWEAKKDSIDAKREYYEAQIEKYTAMGDSAMVAKMESRLAELKEFETHGAEYSRLLAERDALRQTAFSLKPKPDAQTIFGADAYTQERKDAAVWAQTPREADSVLRRRTGEVWENATSEERSGIYYYTSSYSPYNEPLRGWEYGVTNYQTGAGHYGVGNTDLSAGSARQGERLNAMTDIISRCTYDQDIWLQRGCNYGGMDSFFNCSMELLRSGTQQELEDALLGTTPTEFGFMSCGSSRGRGFIKPIILNVYAPSGTQMMYVEPFSAFGNGGAYDSWDGVSTQSTFGNELETILQQGTQFRVTKVERASDGTLFFDLEVINQLEPQRWIP